MAKFSGKVGFVSNTKTAPGIFTNIATERDYKGDILRSAKRWSNEQTINPDLIITNRISIVADRFALSNLDGLKYVILKNKKWSISSFDIEHPRLILNLGGVYNGQ
jgi:hypothetical protein